MKIPSFLYGTYKDVKAKCRPIATKLRKGASLSSLSGEMLDTDTTPGLIVIDGPNPLVGGKTCFHCFTLFRTIREGFNKREDLDPFAPMFLENDWSFLGLLSQASYGLVLRSEWHLPFVRAFARHWPSISIIGPRYSRGSDEGKYLWEVPNTMDYVLGQQGIRADELGRHFDNATIQSFLRRAEERHSCA